MAEVLQRGVPSRPARRVPPAQGSLREPQSDPARSGTSRFQLLPRFSTLRFRCGCFRSPFGRERIMAIQDNDSFVLMFDDPKYAFTDTKA